MTDFDKEVHKWQNEMRTNPKSFIPDLQAMLPRFNGNMYTRPGDPVLLATQEGAAAVQELIDFLGTASPLEPLEWDDNIAKASKDHINDMAASGATGHTGQDGSSPFDRMERYTKLEGSSGENLSYGQDDPKGVIIQLAVDDGVQGRGHRKNIMNPAFVKHGCYTGDHSKYKRSTCLNYNGSFGKQSAVPSGGGGGGSFDMQAFMSEPVQWEDPPGHMGYSESTSASMGGGKATKTVKRTYKMQDGSTVEKTQVITRDC